MTSNQRARRGTVVVNEGVYPISRIELGNGTINFWLGPLAHPVALPVSSEVRVHAPDGTLIATAPWELADPELRRLRTMRPGDTASVCFPLRIYDVLGWPRAQNPPVGDRPAMTIQRTEETS